MRSRWRGVRCAFERSLVKASANYRNASWDLVDASREKDFNLAAVKAEDLPVEMRQLDAAERQAYVDKHARERADLQARINELNREREKFVARQTKEAAGTNTLDSAIISAIREQSAKRNFLFE